MSILRLLQQAQGGRGLGQLAAQLGLDEAQADSLTEMLAPAIGSAANRQAQSGGLGSLLGALRGEEQANNFDDAAAAASAQGQAQGRNFLTALLGGSDQADGLAAEAAARAGVDAGTVQQFLPALAAMAQGGLQRQLPDSSIDAIEASEAAPAGGDGLMGMVGGLLGGGQAATSSGGAMGMLSQLLDADGDGSVMDDVLGRLMR
jgi:hypothetical protein